jgi:hypothetical protein
VKSQLVAGPGHHTHPPQPTTEQPFHPVRRVGPLDRAALHLGVALIKWGRRPVKADARDQLARFAASSEARAELERTREEAQSLNLLRFR